MRELVILMLAYNRENYLRITLATLNEALRGRDVRAVMYDGGAALPEIANECEWLTVRRQEDHWKRDVNAICAHSLSAVLREYPEVNHVLRIGSDAVVHPQFMEGVERILREFPAYKYASIFNAGAHGATGEYGNGFVRKRRVGGFGSLISRAAWEAVCAQGFNHDYDDFEVALSQYAAQDVPCTLRSYLEHIGLTGVNYRTGGEVDRALNFWD